MKTYHGLQGLRYIAALLVVLMHTAEAIHQRMSALPVMSFTFGGIGVDIFFVISGFIMMATTDSRRTRLDGKALARDFLVKRLIRIAPLYWFYTSLKILLVLLLPALALRTQLEPVHLVCSYLLLPCNSPWGLIQPVMPVGWTLSFELLFYLVFAASIALGYHRVIGSLLAFGLIFVGKYFWPESTFFRFFGQSIIFEFCLGMLAFLLIQRIRGSLMGFGALMLGVAWACWGFYAGLPYDRLIVVGIPAFLIVLGVLLLEDQIASSPLKRWLSHLGDSSYSLYLSHSFTVPSTVTLLAALQLDQPFALFVLTAALATLVGVLSFHWIERPVQRCLSNAWQRQTLRTSTP